MNFDWHEVKIVVKLDPDKKLQSEVINELKGAGVDLIIIGGTQNISRDNTSKLYDMVRKYSISCPVLQELSEPDAAIKGVDGYLLPVVLNTGNMRWLRDAHLEAILMYGELIPWNYIETVGYLVCNPDSAVAVKTEAGFPDSEEANAYLTLAEKVYNLPHFYVEYSGQFGDTELISCLNKKREKIHLIYGGGITSVDKARVMLEHADTIVIGNFIYENPKKAVEIIFKIREEL